MLREDVGEEKTAALWNAERSAEVGIGLRATGLDYAESTARRVLEILDGQAMALGEATATEAVKWLCERSDILKPLIPTVAAALLAWFGQRCPRAVLVSYEMIGPHDQFGRMMLANLRERDPECDVNVVTGESRRVRIRAALSNSLGFGGSNSSLIFRNPEEVD